MRTMLPCSSSGSAVGIDLQHLAVMLHARVVHADEIDLQIVVGIALFTPIAIPMQVADAPLGHLQLDFVVGVSRGDGQQHLARFDWAILKLLFHVPGDDLAGDGALDREFFHALVDQPQLFARHI